MSRLKLDPIPRVGCMSEIFKDLAASWPATKKWTPDYLKRKYGGLSVQLHDASYAQPGKHYMKSLRTVSFSKYLDLITTSATDLRMFGFNLYWKAPELLKDVRFPAIAPDFSKRVVLMFFGCKGSITPMHYDVDMKHVFHTVLYGKKRIVLLANEQSRNVYCHPYNTRSYVDVDNPDFNRFPRLKNVAGYEEIIGPGETLFIPSGYFHHVVYEEGGYGVTVRCRHASFERRLRGYVNIVIHLPIDKVMNALLPERWFRFKEQRAHWS
jgi:hypothetical protein